MWTVSGSVGSGTKHHEARKFPLVNQLAAEFIGDAIFVFIGSISALNSVAANAVTHSSFAHGLTIFVLVTSFGHISGGHFNPAVTLAVALVGKFPMRHLAPYWMAQIGGGFAGALLVRSVTQYSEYERVVGGATLLAPDVYFYQALIIEALLTAILTLTVLMTAVDTQKQLLAPLAIGMTLTLAIFGAGSISGASMNPARSFGPGIAATFFIGADEASIISVIWRHHYVYWVGPAVGASIGALLYRVAFGRNCGPNY